MSRITIGMGSKDLGLTSSEEVEYNVLRRQKSWGEIMIGTGSNQLGLTRFEAAEYNVLRPQNE